MQQKVQFINTIAHNPKLIILDEPFTGLDPVNTELIRSEILKLKDEGATIIFSTHRMEQVEEICEDIVLINSGKVVLGETLKFGHYTQEGIKIKEGQKIIEVIKEFGEFIPLAKGRKITAGQLLERFLFDRKKQYDFVYP